MKSIDSKQAGLTSIQILIVVIVLGIIAAVLLAPRLLGQAGRALQAQAAEDIETLGIALDRYAKDNGDYPSTEQGLKALWERPEAPPRPINWVEPYIQIPITEDPWGNPYIYVRPGNHDRYGYDLISFGSDGVEGGTGEAEDIVSWIRRDE
ncbi:type II secretion system protein GspG [Candidatus Poribacteria bacterium]|nr:type II secretion system protein GspG [Candidatus Poribacteria bacterium]